MCGVYVRVWDKAHVRCGVYVRVWDKAHVRCGVYVRVWGACEGVGCM